MDPRNLPLSRNAYRLRCISILQRFVFGIHSYSKMILGRCFCLRLVRPKFAERSYIVSSSACMGHHIHVCLLMHRNWPLMTVSHRSILHPGMMPPGRSMFRLASTGRVGRQPPGRSRGRVWGWKAAQIRQPAPEQSLPRSFSFSWRLHSSFRNRLKTVRSIPAYQISGVLSTGS